MNRLLIESGPHESRVVLIEGDRLVEVQIEDPNNRPSVGNIYKGRISRVLPGIEAAFVDVGLERDAFLYAGDIYSPNGTGHDPEETDSEPDQKGSIDQLVSAGDEILVQVVKDPIPNKGARVTAQLSLPGRCVVLLPGAESVGVSRRVIEVEERDRLISILEELRPPGFGVIARTAAAGRSAVEVGRDLHCLVGLWKTIDLAARKKMAPNLVHQELDLPLRTLRDQPSDQLEEIAVDGEATYREIDRYLEDSDPDLRAKVSLFEEPGTLFDSADIDSDIRKALRARVWLPSGGYIVINPTEALVAIDINTGRFTGSEDIETTALEVNRQAAVEIARQLRLRDLGGIIVVDFIDMAKPENRSAVVELFGAELEKDRTRVQMSEMSELGLVEVTRKRSRSDLTRQLTEPCPCCNGRGRVHSLRATCLDLRRELLRRHRVEPDRGFGVRAHPRVVEALQQDEKEIFQEIETRLGTTIETVPDPVLRPDEFEIFAP